MSLKPDTVENDPYEKSMPRQRGLVQLEHEYGDILRRIAVNSANGQNCDTSVRDLLGTLSQVHRGVTVEVDEGQVIVQL